MAPQKHYEQGEFNTDYPTSPWTEPYQTATSEMEAVREMKVNMSQHNYDHETQSPTHDALSDIYNRVS